MKYTLKLKPLEKVVMTELEDEVKTILIQIQDQVKNVDNYTSKYKEVLKSLTERYVKDFEYCSLYGSFPCKESELYISADWSSLIWQLRNSQIKQVNEVREDGYVYSSKGISIEIDGFIVVYHNYKTTVVEKYDINSFLSKERSY